MTWGLAFGGGASWFLRGGSKVSWSEHRFLLRLENVFSFGGYDLREILIAAVLRLGFFPFWCFEVMQPRCQLECFCGPQFWQVGGDPRGSRGNPSRVGLQHTYRGDDDSAQRKKSDLYVRTKSGRGLVPVRSVATLNQNCGRNQNSDPSNDSKGRPLRML